MVFQLERWLEISSAGVLVSSPFGMLSRDVVCTPSGDVIGGTVGNWVGTPSTGEIGRVWVGAIGRSPLSN